MDHTEIFHLRDHYMMAVLSGIAANNHYAVLSPDDKARVAEQIVDKVLNFRKAHYKRLDLQAEVAKASEQAAK